MKRNIITIILIAALILLLILATRWYQGLSGQFEAEPAPAESPAESAELAPDFTVLDGEGSEVKLSDMLGKPVVINFWATWCGFCKMEFPAFDDAFLEYGDDVQFMMIDLTDGKRDTIESASEFISDGGYSFPVYFDTSLEATAAYGAYSIPLSVFINADGTLSASHRGAMSEDILISYIEELIK